MADYDSDQAKELRRTRLLKIKPKAAPMMLTESEFNREYIEYRFVALEHMPDLEEGNNVMFCPACAKDVNNVMGKRRVLHISYEDDVLGNFPLIAVAKCQGCEWEEMIPVVKQEISSEDQALLRRFHLAQRRGSPLSAGIANTPHIGANGGLLSPKKWSDDMLDAFKNGPSIMYSTGVDASAKIRFGQVKADKVWHEVSKLQEEAREVENARRQIDMIEQIEQEDMRRQQMKMAQMGQMYGMGQAQMQNIGRAMAQQMDRSIMEQMLNSYALPQEILKDKVKVAPPPKYTVTHDELTEWKEAPAAAAKAAHQVLLNKVKQVFKK